MKITMYELLGLIKDGKAPRKILFKNEIWFWGYDTYTTYGCLNNTPDAQISMFSKYKINYCLNDFVEIIEEEKEIKKISYRNIGGRKKQEVYFDLVDDCFFKINELVEILNEMRNKNENNK